MFENRSTWLDGVIPIGTDCMLFQPPGLDLVIRDSDPLLIGPPQHAGLDREPGFRSGPADAGQDGLQGAHRLAGPVDAAAAEQAVVRPMPLRATPRYTLYRHS